MRDKVLRAGADALELQGGGKRLLALSQTAFDSLTEEQQAVIAQSTQLVPLNIPTIEMTGGSVRCMIAGNHLAERARPNNEQR